MTRWDQKPTKEYPRVDQSVSQLIEMCQMPEEFDLFYPGKELVAQGPEAIFKEWKKERQQKKIENVV